MDGLSEVHFSYNIQQKEEFWSDVNSLKLIISNLLINAIKYRDHSKENQVAKVEICVNKTSAIIRVIDNGIGMDQVEKRRVLDRFYQANNKKSGFGLGLFLVFQALEKLGGELEIKSEPIVGSQFICTIPNSGSVQ